MGTFVFTNSKFEEKSVERVTNVLETRGHENIKCEKVGGGIFLIHAEKILSPTPNFIKGKGLNGESGDFIIGVGAFFYDGATGVEALKKVYKNLDDVLNDNPIYGHWAICVKKGDTVYVMNDMSGMMRLYYYQDGSSITISTSMLAVVASLPNPKFDKTRLAGFFAAKYANFIPFVEGVELLSPNKYLLIKKGSAPEWHERKDSEYKSIDTTEEAVESVRNLFQNQVQALESIGKEQVGVELSAGLDSRLIVSVIKSAGFNYNFVHYPLYGPDKDIAYQVANGIGKEIYLQEDAAKLEPEDFEKNYGEFDFCFNFFNHHASKRQMIKNSIQFTGGFGEVIDLPEFYSDEDESMRNHPEASFLLKELTIQPMRKILRKGMGEKWMNYIIDYFKCSGVPIGNKMSETEQMAFYHILVPRLILSNTISAYNACTRRYGMFEEYHFTRQVDGISFKAKEGRKLTLALIKGIDPELACYPFISRLVTRRDSVAGTTELPTQYKHWGNLKKKLPDWFIDLYYRRKGHCFNTTLLSGIDFSIYDDIINTKRVMSRPGLYKGVLERLYSLEVIRQKMNIKM